MFDQPELAEEWIKRTIYLFGHWVRQKRKSYWDFVRFYGHRKGVLKELSRPQFAKLLKTTCYEALAQSDTEDSLKEVMQKFPYKDCLRKRSKEERKRQAPEKEWAFDLLPDSHVCRALKRELDELYNQPLCTEEVTKIPTMEDRLKDYLYALAQKEQFSKVFSRPEYCGCTATISVEQYVKQDFMDQRKPSRIVVFECVDGTVDETVVTQYSGRYSPDRRIKLYVCSTHGFDMHTQKMASDRDVGLVLINPNEEMTSNCYVVPRSVQVFEMQAMEREMLSGHRSMTTPFIIYDECGISCSIADTLTNHSIAIKDNLCLKAPRWTNQYIESRALDLVRDKVDEFVRQMELYPTTHQVPYFDADPDQLLADAGYELEEKDMSATGQLAVIDLKRKKVSIDSCQSYKIHSKRYSKSHELGHGILHSHLNVVAFGESDQTLSSDALASSHEQKWLEHQANHFAACLLMPETVVGYLYGFYCQRRFGRNVFRRIFLGSQQCQQDDFYSIVRPMAKQMNVSIGALKWRLVNLDLVRIIK